MVRHKKLTRHDEQKIRMKVYDKKRRTFKSLGLRPRLNASMFDSVPLPVPAGRKRSSNFKQFVKENFASDMDTGAWPDGSLTELKLYIYFEKYSKTKEGAALINGILQNNKISERTKKIIFKVRYNSITKAGQRAQGGFDWVDFSDDFLPKGQKFPGGELVDPISVIGHELGHTRFYNKKPKVSVSIEYERANVIIIENPMRKKMGFDYRYTYYQRATNQTINIITNKIGKGKLTFLKTNPEILVEIGDHGAFI